MADTLVVNTFDYMDFDVKFLPLLVDTSAADEVAIRRDF